MDLSPAHQPDPKWATAVPDWEARIMARRSLMGAMHFDHKPIHITDILFDPVTVSNLRWCSGQ
jgi:hypothetical protein